MVESPQRIWIEAGDECPYFYEAHELHDVEEDVIEYVRADLYAALEAKLAEMTRRRDEWRKKAEGYDDVRRALREKVGAPWPPHMSRLLWAGIAADEKKRADDAEAQLAALEAQLAASRKELSGIPGELRDKIAEAIRGDVTDLGDPPWETLPEERKNLWREDADRVLSAIKDYLTPAPAEPAPAARSGAVRVKQLEWKETHTRRSEEDPTTEWDGGFEAESALGFYEIRIGFGSDAYYWSVINPLGDVVGSNFEDPLYAKAAAQADYERRILAALELAEPAPAAEPVACVERGSEQSTPQPESRLREALANLVQEIDDLVSESEGVAGLHLNGDVAEWGDLLPGGPYERLTSLDDARAALKEASDGER